MYINVFEYRRYRGFKNYINIILINLTHKYLISYIFLATSKWDFEATQGIPDFIIRNPIAFFYGCFYFHELFSILQI